MLLTSFHRRLIFNILLHFHEKKNPTIRNEFIFDIVCGVTPQSPGPTAEAPLGEWAVVPNARPLQVGP